MEMDSFFLATLKIILLIFALRKIGITYIFAQRIVEVKYMTYSAKKTAKSGFLKILSPKLCGGIEEFKYL